MADKIEESPKLKAEFPACHNLGLKVAQKKARPIVPWLPAIWVESLLTRSLAVYSAKDENGLYTKWYRADQFPEGFVAEVLGFVIGPYDIPQISKDAVAEESEEVSTEEDV